MIKWGSLYNLLLISALLGAIGIYVNHVPKQQMQQGESVTRTHQVLHKLAILSEQMQTTDAIGSGYLQTHSHNQYEAYRRSLATLEQTLEEITNLTSDNDAEQQHVAAIALAIKDLAPQLTKDIKPQPVASAIDPTRGLTDSITQRINSMRGTEERLLNQRELRWQTSVMRTQLFFFCGIALVYLLIFLAYVTLRRETHSRERLLDIERRNHDAQRATTARMTQIVSIQQNIINQRLNLQGAMDLITRHTQTLAHADGAAIEMLEGDEMISRAACGMMEPFLQFRLKADASLSGLCLSSESVLICNDSEKDDRVDRDACRKVGIRSIIVVPLFQEQKAIGILKVACTRPDAFTKDDIDILHLLGGLLSTTLRDALNADAMQDSNKNLIFMNELLLQEKKRLESDTEELKDRAATDGLTGLKNHRYFQEFMAHEFARIRRYPNPLSLIMLDVDHFKRINDQYGHPAGDAVLKQLAALLSENTRPSDCVARYGGEEFGIILTHTPVHGAVYIAERLREIINGTVWPTGPLTVSMGISGIEHGAGDAHTLITQADKALYQSKATGRDKLTIFAADGEFPAQSRSHQTQPEKAPE